MMRFEGSRIDRILRHDVFITKNYKKHLRKSGSFTEIITVIIANRREDQIYQSKLSDGQLME